MSTQIDFYKHEKDVISLRNKFLHPDYLTLSYLFNQYFQENVAHGPRNTYVAKLRDIEYFFKYYNLVAPADFIYDWTPSITKGYIKYLRTELKLKPTTINRKLATLRHAVSWMERKSIFKNGTPFDNVSDMKLEAVLWKGLTDLQVMRLKSACDKALTSFTRHGQNPLLYITVFYVLLNTGLRESELCDLNYGQYKGKYFSLVQRKGNKISEQIILPKEARVYLDQYLSSRKDIKLDDPMFINKWGNRLTHDNVYYYCMQLKKMANLFLPQDQQFHFSPHSLRHAFLKRVADKMGIHAAQELSGNVSLKEIYRYTRPSFEEIEHGVENLY